MYRSYRQLRKTRRKDVVVSLITIIIVTIVIKVVYGNFQGSSLAYTTLAYQPQNFMQPRMDIKAIQTSLEDVLKQYQQVINSTDKTNKSTLVSEVDKLYSIAASDNTNVTSFEISSNNEQIIDDLTQGSNYLAASLFEIKDSLDYTGDFSASQLKNSKDDLTLAIKELELARQN
ncbi:conserved exported hypothetical protein [Candidatus Desulfosporosinus infrequens]|uniref:Uncharacterized protein n=1 Tax=Candidatus Desulfosporosinus infrequens TaxID=2043169 RepID=A0A2U3LX66_9FIRM|nr:conserved exported hypothetical protein [Candidatus Desulfosporosinus infrequens]